MDMDMEELGLAVDDRRAERRRAELDVDEVR
jgi:hypothetical protein